MIYPIPPKQKGRWAGGWVVGLDAQTGGLAAGRGQWNTHAYVHGYMHVYRHNAMHCYMAANVTLIFLWLVTIPLRKTAHRFHNEFFNGEHELHHIEVITTTCLKVFSYPIPTYIHFACEWYTTSR